MARFPRSYSDPFSLSLTADDTDPDSPLSYFHPSSSLSSTSSSFHCRSSPSVPSSPSPTIPSSAHFPRPPKSALPPVPSRATAKGTFYLDQYTFEPWFNSVEEFEQASMDYWADDESPRPLRACESRTVQQKTSPPTFLDSPAGGSISSLFDETTEAFHPSHPRLERRTSQRLERRESSARSVLLEVELGEEAMSSMSSGGSIIEVDVQMEEEEQGGK